MIRIKVVDAQNIRDVCRLTAAPHGGGATMGECGCCNAMSIAQATYSPDMHPNAIYHNQVLIGFFMYQRAENQADTATICRFMIGYPFQQKGLGKKAFEHVLRGLKIQGVKKIIVRIDDANMIAKKLCLSCGFQFTGKTEHDECCYTLQWSF